MILVVELEDVANCKNEEYVVGFDCCGIVTGVDIRYVRKVLN